MKTQLILDLDDIAELIGDSEKIKKTFPDGNWIVQWYFVDEEFKFKLIVKEPDEKDEEEDKEE